MAHHHDSDVVAAHLESKAAHGLHQQGSGPGHVDPLLHDIKVNLEKIQHKLKLHPHTEKELQELAEQINAIDAKRVDNHFTVNGKIPAGQAVLSDLLANCYALLEGLRVQSKSD
eukprot:TRINITY_DN669_c0_g1_i3.p1 TRINITY_DN669_c0_g1~~TRINITY_DN669_c0_g1_i3.p1  ORF type:complete len:114 (-),score=29.61 TRINITY_DN669_c0_g1_i3:262-603(-)